MGLTVLHAPLHAPSARQHPIIVTREIRSHGATMVGLTEAYGVLPALARMSDYRLVVETGGRDKRRGQRDNPILVRKELRSLGSGQVFGCHASTPLRIAPERWITYATFEVDGVGPVCHVVLHPHAAVQERPTGRLLAGVDRALQFGRQMEVFAALLTFAKAMSWAIVVTADMNFRDAGDDIKSPYAILRAQSLKIVSHNIDCIAFTPKLKLEVSEVAAPDTITDHPWLIGVSAG